MLHIDEIVHLQLTCLVSKLMYDDIQYFQHLFRLIRLWWQ